MKRILFLFVFLGSTSLQASWSMDVGPHFHYTTIEFDTPSDIKGYAAGVTAAIELDWCYLYSRVEFEGTWNAGPIFATTA